MSAGTIKRDPVRKTWYFVVDVSSADGRRKQVKRRGFATRKAAQEALDAIRESEAKGLLVDANRMTLADYLNTVWLPSLPSRMRPTTIDMYRRIVRVHILPALGGVGLQRLERTHVRRFVDDLTPRMSPKSVRLVHVVLAKALADAVELNLVARNVASRTKLPAPKPSTPRAWTAAELGRFLDHVAGTRHYPLWRLIATTGCRRGEALGLHWSEVDLDETTITITNQRTIAGGRTVEYAPKTRAGSRTVALDEATVAALRAWRAQQAAERLVMGAGWPDTGLVFTHADGVPLWPTTVTDWFGQITDELGLPRIGVHGLRHSAATWMIGAGVSPKLVQQRLGHANVGITLGLYTHVLPGHDKAAAEAFAAALGTSRPDSVTKS